MERRRSCIRRRIQGSGRSGQAGGAPNPVGEGPRVSGTNEVRIEFGSLRESSPGASVYSDGHLIIIGVDLGKITLGVVGHVGGLFRKKKWAEVERKFGARDFRTTSWNHFTDHRYTYEDKRYFECKNRKCFVFVRAN